MLFITSTSKSCRALHAVSCVTWAWCSLAALAVLLVVLIVRLRVEGEMAGPYCYWEAGFPSRSFDVYGQYNYYGHCNFPGPGPVSPLSCWVGPVGLPHMSVQTKLEWCLGCTARDVEIQSNLSEWEFHCNTLSTTLQRRSAEYADLRPGSTDIMIVLVFTNLKWPCFTARRILDNGWIFFHIRYPATGSRS